MNRTKQQLAALMNISIRTFYRRIQKHQLNLPNTLLSPQEQIKLFEQLGYPHLVLQIQQELKRQR